MLSRRVALVRQRLVVSSSSSSSQFCGSAVAAAAAAVPWFQAAACSSSTPPDNTAEIADVANCFRLAPGNRIPLGRVIHGVSPATKSKIFKSGKGLEGYLSQFPAAFAVEKVGNDKFLLLVDERLREQSKADARPTVVPTLNRHEHKQQVRQEQLERAQKRSAQQAAERKQLKEQQEKAGAAKPGADAKPKLQTLSESKSGAGDSGMWVDEMMKGVEKDKADKEASAAAAADAADAAAAAAADAAASEKPLEESASVPPEEDPGDTNPELTSRVKACCPGENQWYKIANIHESLYKGTSVQVGQLVSFLVSAKKHFWVDPASGFVCRRLPYHTQAPPNLQLRKVAGGGGGGASGGAGVSAAAPHEWGEARNAPTSQDVYEILRYIPIHWTDFGSISLPDAVRKKHIRVSSKLTWFAKQPKFFDVRFVGGTVEIRRAPVLHPSEHGLTKAEAEKLVQQRMEEDARYGSPLVLLQARGVSVPQSASATSGSSATAGSVASSATAASGASSTAATTAAGTAAGTPASSSAATASPAAAAAAAAAGAAGGSAAVDAVSKALVRIAPGYFVTADAIIRRATKKMGDDDLLLAASKMPLLVERLLVKSKTNPAQQLSLYRRKLGVDDTTWKPEFIREIEESPNPRLLNALMTHTCAQWDRTHFLYVRLPDADKIASGGFDEMVEFMRKHPNVFRVGEFFVKRNDLSDPQAAEADPEPTSKVVTSTKQLEDNPYHQLVDLAAVFHYLTPESDSVSLSHYVDSSSPAMRSVLPPRILTILQAYPEKFSCREIAPGTFAVSRAKAAGEGGGADGSGGADGAGADASLDLTKDEAVEKLIAIIPPRGVDIAHIEATMPQQLRRAIVRLFGAGGVRTLVSEYAFKFHVVKNPPYESIFARRS